MKNAFLRQSRNLLLAACAGLALTPSQAYGQTQPRVHYSILAQDLGTALTELGRQSNREIYFLSDLTRGRRSSPLEGMLTLDEALQRLLSRSGLSYRVNASGSIVVERGQIGGADERGESESGPGATSAENVASDGDDDDNVAIVVTGTRIRSNTDTATSAPVAVIRAETLTQRGFVQAGEALNEMTSIRPVSPLTARNGQQFPNLFNLGPGRTLTLVNGRRTVTSSSGLGDSAVDTNIIPTSLLDRIDVVQGGGASIYGSGAIAGVINYVLKQDFEGIKLDAQAGITERGDVPTYSFRGAAGTNFADGKGNVAVSFEYSKSGSLLAGDRRTAPFTAPNPLNTGPNDGIPATVYVDDFRAYHGPVTGAILTSPVNPFPTALLIVNGAPATFNAAGTALVPYNIGTPVFGAPFFSTGADGPNFFDGNSIYSATERFVGNAIGHYDLAHNVRVSTELLYAKTKGTDPAGSRNLGQWNPILPPPDRPLAFTKNNAFLTPEMVAALSAASPSFAAGGPLFLGKAAPDFFPDQGRTVTTTDTYRALLALEGDFRFAGRRFDWSLSYSHGEAHQKVDGWNYRPDRLLNAFNAVRNSAGQIVCAINADVPTSNDDPSCVPVNLFGTGNITDAARDYYSAKSAFSLAGTAGNFVNKQDNVLAIISGDLVQLPGGKAKFALTYEHRAESAKFTPLEADQLGLVFSRIPVLPASGKYNTDEFAAELEIPLVGDEFTLPLVESLDVHGSYRYVDHSIAGKEDVWGVGLRWGVAGGLTLRGSLSRNFRSPSINQTSAPSSTNLGTAANPCSATLINSGPAPALRRANCLSLFEANPTFGVSVAAPLGSPAALRLAGFQDTPVTDKFITSGGNPNLSNEISKVKTFGFVFQPPFVRGLTVSADRIILKLTKALSLFTISDFAASCFDNTPQPADLCNSLTYLPNGNIATGRNTTVNAGFVIFHAENYNINYSFPLNSIFPGRDIGRLDLGLQATHNTLQETSVTGTTVTKQDNTPALPTWVVRFEAHYTKGPFRLNYGMFYLPKARLTATTTIEDAPNGRTHLSSNIRHNISVEYNVGDHYAFRVGVDNLTDRGFSYPNLSYGDILGRRFFAGMSAKW